MLLKALCWALIFILRIRFPPGSSITTVLNNRYNNEEALQAFRKFQRLELKLGKAKLDLEFLTTCLIAVCKTLAPIYRQCQNKLLQDEINAKHARIRVLLAQLTKAQSALVSLVLKIDFIHLKQVEVYR